MDFRASRSHASKTAMQLGTLRAHTPSKPLCSLARFALSHLQNRYAAWHASRSHRTKADLWFSLFLLLFFSFSSPFILFFKS